MIFISLITIIVETSLLAYRIILFLSLIYKAIISKIYLIVVNLYIRYASLKSIKLLVYIKE